MKKGILIMICSLLCMGAFAACGENQTGKKEDPPVKEDPVIAVKEETPVEMEDYAELWRPQLHYSTKDSWVNDPNGLVYYNGVWHMYYQANPHRNIWGNLHWGHATSTDLINWKEEGFALFPDSVGVMYSGTAAVDVNNTSGFFSDTEEKCGIVAAYSTDTQHVGIAYSKDGGYTFEKVSETKPVIANPGGNNHVDFRDPHLFWYEPDQSWKLVVAGGIVRIYESKNLVDWTLCSEDPSLVTECPNLFEMKVEGTNETKWVLSCGGRGYYIGTFDGKKFTPETGKYEMDVGPDTYAGITFSNAPNGRIIMVSWLNNWAYTSPEGQWNGAFSLPVEMKLAKISDIDYRLIQNPVEEVKSARKATVLNEKDKTYSNGANPLKDINSNCFELNAEIDVSKNSQFEFNFCTSATERIVVKYNDGFMTFDRSNCDFAITSLTQNFGRYQFYVDPDSMPDNILKIRIFVDVSNLEMYVNDGNYYLVGRIQPFSSSLGMAVGYDGEITFKSLRVDLLKSIWCEEGKVPVGLHISDDCDIEIDELGELDTGVKVNVYNGDNSKMTVSVDNPQCVQASVDKNGNLILDAKEDGEAVITFTYGSLSRTINVKVNTGAEKFTSNLGNLEAVGGTVTVGKSYMTLTAGGDMFAMADKEATSLMLEADIMLNTQSQAAALIFRYTDSANFYSANFDKMFKNVRIWKRVNGDDFTVDEVRFDVVDNVWYHIKVEAIGEDMTVWFNGDKVIETSDKSHTSGKVGFNIYTGSAKFNNLNFEEREDPENPSKPPHENKFSSNLGQLEAIGGSVEIKEDYMQLSASGDMFAVASNIISDCTLEADITLNSVSQAAALIFRFTDGSTFYCLNFDKAAKNVRLWKRVNWVDANLGVYNFDIKDNEEYHLKVKVIGNSIKGWFNGDLVIEATDDSLSSGKVGLNIYTGSARFNNIDLNVLDK